MARRNVTDDVEEYEGEDVGPQQHDVWDSLLVNAPAWLISIAAHAIFLLCLSQLGRLFADDRQDFQANIEEQLEELPEIEIPTELPNPEVEIEEETPVEDDLEEEDIDVEIDEPIGDVEDPNDKLPLMIPRIALGEGGASQYVPGAFGGRGGRGRRRSLNKWGGTKESEEAVQGGLWWLAEVQEADGSWDCAKWGGNAQGGDIAVTGLALLCFLGAGESDVEGKYKDNIRRACAWLAKNMNGQGRFQLGSRFYGQGAATMALSEAYGMGRTDWVGKAAQRAINCIVKNQPDTGGFGYDGSGEDTSVSGWQFMALKSARIAGLDVPDSAFEKAKRYLRDCYKPDGSSSYRVSNPGWVTQAGPGAMTAIGLTCRIFLGWDKADEMVARPATLLDNQSVQLNDLYYTYYATLSMFQVGGDKWERWNKALRDPLLAKQEDVKKDKKLGGSWVPDTVWGGEGGRVYSTAMAILSLEVYYRFLPIYRTQ